MPQGVESSQSVSRSAYRRPGRARRDICTRWLAVRTQLRKRVESFPEARCRQHGEQGESSFAGPPAGLAVRAGAGALPAIVLGTIVYGIECADSPQLVQHVPRACMAPIEFIEYRDGYWLLIPHVSSARGVTYTVAQGRKWRPT